MTVKSAKGFLIVMGILSIIPVFLVVFIPSLLAHRAFKENGLQKIKNALEVWKDDLGNDYEELSRELANLAGN